MKKREREAIREFVEAWDELPVGHHSPSAVNRWLNSLSLKAAVVKLKIINEENKKCRE
jgi:hypothetical protein